MDVGKLVGDTGGEYELPRDDNLVLSQRDLEPGLHLLGLVDPSVVPLHGVGFELLPPDLEQLGGADSVAREERVNGRGGVVPRLPRVAHQHLAAGPAQDQGGTQARRPAADDHHVVVELRLRGLLLLGVGVRLGGQKAGCRPAGEQGDRLSATQVLRLVHGVPLV